MARRMTVQLTAQQRRALTEAKAKVRAIMDPVREAQKIARAKGKRERAKAIKPGGRTAQAPRAG
jgi:lipopolysaccharide export system protein LptA